MDADSTITDIPYENQILIDFDIKTLSPFLSLYGKWIAYVEKEYEQKESMTTQCMQRPHLVLYVRNSCPYCIKVTSYLEKEQKTVPIKDITSSVAADELIQIGGKRQVPCLIIDGKALYESSDIIDWLKAHKDQY